MNRIASAYDRNPSRLILVAKSYRKKNNNRRYPVLIGTLISLAVMTFGLIRSYSSF
jgi:hypothetical protein